MHALMQCLCELLSPSAFVSGLAASIFEPCTHVVGRCWQTSRVWLGLWSCQHFGWCSQGAGRVVVACSSGRQ